VATYVQAPGGDTWHWCVNCSHYPSNIAHSQTPRPAWDLCEQCKDKEKNGTCQHQ
jgi:hypothetical protein